MDHYIGIPTSRVHPSSNWGGYLLCCLFQIGAGICFVACLKLGRVFASLFVSNWDGYLLCCLFQIGAGICFVACFKLGRVFASLFV